jgi:hypothetical protein
MTAALAETLGPALIEERDAYQAEALALRVALADANARATQTAAVIESLLEQLAAAGVHARLAPLWSRPRKTVGRAT